jgi:hypothetical protein
MLTITFDDAAFQNACNDIEKQVHFAGAQALTKTAMDAQEEVKRQLPERFTIRTTWLARGIRIRPASRNRLESAVLVKDEFMEFQEVGGDKTSFSGDALGIPVGARPTPQSVTRPSKFPGALLAKPGYFIAPIAKGADTMVVWRRTGKGKKQRMTLMYVFKRAVHLKPRFGFNTTVRKVAIERFPKRFAEALQQAMATAR